MAHLKETLAELPRTFSCLLWLDAQGDETTAEARSDRGETPADQEPERASVSGTVKPLAKPCSCTNCAIVKGVGRRRCGISF